MRTNYVSENKELLKLSAVDLNDINGAALQELKLDSNWYAKENYITENKRINLLNNKEFDILFE